MNFKRYRLAAGYSESIIKVQNSHLNHFKSWYMTQDIDPGQITYKQILEFIDHERTRHIKQQSIAGMLNSLKVYFDFLMDTRVIAHNVFRRIRIRKAGRRALPGSCACRPCRPCH